MPQGNTDAFDLTSLESKCGGLASLAPKLLSRTSPGEMAVASEITETRLLITKFKQKNKVLTPLLVAGGWNKGARRLLRKVNSVAKMYQFSAYELLKHFFNIILRSSQAAIGFVLCTDGNINNQISQKYERNVRSPVIFKKEMVKICGLVKGSKT